MGHEGTEGSYTSTPSITWALDGGGWSMQRPSRFDPGRDPVPAVQEVGSASGLVLTSAKSLASIRIRSPDRPARSESLQLSTELPIPTAGLRII